MTAATRSLGPFVTVLFGAERGKYPDGNSVLVRGRESSVLIDPSLSVHAMSVHAMSVHALSVHGLSGHGMQPHVHVEHVLLTHPHEDHVAGLSAVRADGVAVHRADLAALQSLDGLMLLYGIPRDEWPAMQRLVTERFHFEARPDAHAFDDGAEWRLGGATVRAVHAPGHTAGHCVFLVEQDGGPTVMVTGDIDLTGFGPYYGDAASSLDDFETTLAKVRGLAADHHVTFHHKGVVDGHDAFVAAVDAYAAVFRRRSLALLALLDRPRTLDELVADGIVYRAGTRPPLFGESVERHSIRRHLERALADGEIGTDGRQYWAV